MQNIASSPSRSLVVLLLAVALAVFCFGVAAHAQTDSTAAPTDSAAAAPTETAPPAAPASRRHISEEGVLFQKLRFGVFTVFSDNGKGSGFLCDSTGLVVTNSHVVTGSRDLRIQVDEQRKVRARLLVNDKSRDVAVLWANPAAFAGCPVLALAHRGPGEALAFEGERVLAIGSPLSQTRIMTTGVVSKAEERAVISDVSINPGNSGGPLINMDGEVIAINTFGESADHGPGVSGSITIDQAFPSLAAARDSMAKAASAPPEELLPLLPKERFPLDSLKTRVESKKFKLKDYSLDAPRFELSVLTPPALFYFQNQGAMEASKRKKKREEKGGIAAEERYNPLGDWYLWGEYAGEYIPVVTILAQPKIGETGGSVFRGFLGALVGARTASTLEFKGDLYDMKLFRDGAFVEPIIRTRSKTMVNFQSSSLQLQDVANSGLFYYDLNTFRPNGDQWPKITIQMFHVREPNKPIEVKVEKKLLQRMWGDFQPVLTMSPGLLRSPGQPASATDSLKSGGR